MRVKVSDIDGIHATTPQTGQKLLAIIEPALARGEPVVLDFEGVRFIGVQFFYSSVGVLIEKDTVNQLSDLLRYENLHEIGQSALDSVVEYSIRRRDNPRWAEGMDAGFRKWSARE